MPCFSVFKLWHMYAYTHLDIGSKWTHQQLVKLSFFAENSFFLSLIYKFKVSDMEMALLIS